MNISTKILIGLTCVLLVIGRSIGLSNMEIFSGKYDSFNEIVFATNESVNETVPVVDEFVSIYRNQTFELLDGNFDLIIDAGYDPRSYSFKSYNDPEFRYESLPELSQIEILSLQRQFIEDCFGIGAWDNVSYVIEKVRSPETDGIDYFMDTLTSEYITESEYTEAFNKYFEDLKNGIGIEPEMLEYLLGQSEISLEQFRKDSPDTTETLDSVFILLAMSADFMPPVQIVSKDAYDYYIVTFSFNGKHESVSGEYDFTIAISNKNGKYEVCKGFWWQIPEVDNGDV